jgi:transposase-like protein
MNMLEVATMTEDQARDYVESLRWPDGPVCPNCQKQTATKMQGKSHRKGLYQCNNSECRQQFTVKCGSILESSKVSLKKWVLAFHLLCSSKKGFSALQLQRELSLGSYRTAWFMLHRIRHAMEVKSWDYPVRGVVEMDETYVGGKPRHQHGKPNAKRGHGSPKAPVVALIERGREARSAPVERVEINALWDAVGFNPAPNLTLVTDDATYYKNMSRWCRHESVVHSRKEYARRANDGLNVHTNTCESVFALLKRGHNGVYHSMGKPHLHRYVAEYTFRWNHRQCPDSERREAAIKQAPGKRLKYKTSSAKAG